MAKKTSKPATKTGGKSGVKPSKKASVKPGPAAKAPAKASAPAKAPAKHVAKAAAPAPKAAVGKVAAGKPSAKNNGTKAVAGKAAPAGKAPAKAPAGKPAAPVADGKNGRKGITIVQPKPVRRVKPKPKAPMSGVSAVPASLHHRSGLKPLIPSGPAATPHQPLGFHGHTSDGPRHDFKSPFGKKELAHFRQILLQKRIELVRDVSSMESEALKSESGSLSSLPQHMAEQGSETYDQSLSLDLAAADRKLIKEIDDALVRIEKGTYGVCELTGKPIKVERLEELPWARYSIEAARDLERRQMRL